MVAQEILFQELADVVPNGLRRHLEMFGEVFDSRDAISRDTIEQCALSAVECWVGGHRGARGRDSGVMADARAYGETRAGPKGASVFCSSTGNKF